MMVGSSERLYDMGLHETIIALQTLVRTVQGIKYAPEVLVDSAQQFPFAISYPRVGTIEINAGWTKKLSTIFLEVHCSKSLTEKILLESVPYLEKIAAILQNNPTLNGTISNITDIKWEFGKMTYATIETIGYRFEIGIKDL